jgi:predicted nucleic acid-binding Zn ribbon protein
MNENKRTSNESTLGDLISKLMKAYQLDGKLKEIDVTSKWEEMMGRAVAFRTKKISIRNKILYLEIDSSVMREELQYGKTVIIERVNEFAGFEMIRDVWFS